MPQYNRGPRDSGMDIGQVAHREQQEWYRAARNFVGNDANEAKARSQISVLQDTISQRGQHSIPFIPQKTLGRGTYGEVTSVQIPETGCTLAIKRFYRSKVSNTITNIDNTTNNNKGIFSSDHVQQIEGALSRENTIKSITDDHAERIQSEQHMMSRQQHPYIVKTFGVTSTDKEITIVMEMVGNSQRYLLQQCNKLCHESYAVKVAYQQLSALQYCHTKFNLIHRDIKTANVLVTFSGDTKLADFGGGITCKFGTSIDIGSEGFTPVFAAPELILGQKYNHTVDIWGLGCILLEILTHNSPWCGVPSVFNAINHTSAQFTLHYFQQDPSITPIVPEQQQISQECRHFISQCFERNMNQRPQAEQLQKHPWIKKYQKMEILNDTNSLMPTTPITPSLKLSIPLSSPSIQPYSISSSSCISPTKDSIDSGTMNSTVELSCKSLHGYIPPTQKLLFDISNNSILEKRIQSILLLLMELHPEQDLVKNLLIQSCCNMNKDKIEFNSSNTSNKIVSYIGQNITTDSAGIVTTYKDKLLDMFNDFLKTCNTFLNNYLLIIQDIIEKSTIITQQDITNEYLHDIFKNNDCSLISKSSLHNNNNKNTISGIATTTADNNTIRNQEINTIYRYNTSLSSKNAITPCSAISAQNIDTITVGYAPHSTTNSNNDIDTGYAPHLSLNSNVTDTGYAPHLSLNSNVTDTGYAPHLSVNSNDILLSQDIDNIGSAPHESIFEPQEIKVPILLPFQEEHEENKALNGQKENVIGPDIASQSLIKCTKLADLSDTTSSNNTFQTMSIDGDSDTDWFFAVSEGTE